MTVYVRALTPKVRAAIEARLPGVPLEILERPDGFRAY